MDRYDTVLEDGTVYVERDDGKLRVGDLADIETLLGGETYAVTYDERANVASWLDLDEDNTMRFDVAETLASMDYPGEFVEALAAKPMTTPPQGEYPERTTFFASLLQAIWDGKGTLPDDFEA
ncbi:MULTISPECIES: hypothetical protein [unclassified Haladaptatus]|uniref:hypothetical protein n=1 Tax=unclassified Haladaptatus TaxID=2622732 RepID=UPI0023E7C98B|nr:MULTISPECIES: hypothetical protein [unclassified Haladaptatus]